MTYYSGLIEYDTGNAKGLSVTLFMSGCEHYVSNENDDYDVSGHCAGCHNPHTWDFCSGRPITQETINTIETQLSKPYIKNFVISGGEPLHPKNVQAVFDLLDGLSDKGLLKDKNVIIYTGYRNDVLEGIVRQDLSVVDLEFIKCVLDYTNYLITEPYDKTKPTKINELRGSTNQRCFKIINGKKIDITEEYFRSAE